MKIGWTLNVVIMESELTMDARRWYLRKANTGGLSKAALLRMIESAAHLEISLDESKQDWYTKENDESSEKIRHEEDPVYLPRQYTIKTRKLLIFKDFLGLLRAIYYPFATFENQKN